MEKGRSEQEEVQKTILNKEHFKERERSEDGDTTLFFEEE